MSLLLDALKKAAQEKQSSDAADESTKAGFTELELQQTVDRASLTAHSLKDQADAPEELELYDEELTLFAPVEIESLVDHDNSVGKASVDYRITPTPSTVTDEALELLIHKSNRAYRKSRLMTWGGVFAASMILLTASGSYLYFDMLAEIEMMQRKHQIALATLKSKTQIEENLTSLAVVTTSAKKAQVKDPRQSKPAKPATTTLPKAPPGTSRNKRSAQTLSVQREQKRDPLAEALQSGWAAYHNKAYEESRREYRRVLDQEPDNRDALLGLAAVSVQLDDATTAKDIYLQLLELDPRDTHAHAGLAQIAQNNGSDLSEEKLKQLIEYRPDDAYLQFALGNLYIQKNSWSQAQQAFFNAWKADNKNPDYAYNLAVSLDHLGKHEAARAFYEDSLKLASGKHISFSEQAVKTRLAHLGALH